MNKEQELKEVQKQMVLIQLMSAPATMAIGFGIYGVFGVTDNNAFIPILNNIEVAYGLIIGGAILEAFTIKKLIPVMKRQAELNKS